MDEEVDPWEHLILDDDEEEQNDFLPAPLVAPGAALHVAAGQAQNQQELMDRIVLEIQSSTLRFPNRLGEMADLVVRVEGLPMPFLYRFNMSTVAQDAILNEDQLRETLLVEWDRYVNFLAERYEEELENVTGVYNNLAEALETSGAYEVGIGFARVPLVGGCHFQLKKLIAAGMVTKDGRVLKMIDAPEQYGLVGDFAMRIQMKQKVKGNNCALLGFLNTMRSNKKLLKDLGFNTHPFIGKCVPHRPSARTATIEEHRAKYLPDNLTGMVSLDEVCRLSDAYGLPVTVFDKHMLLLKNYVGQCNPLLPRVYLLLMHEHYYHMFPSGTILEPKHCTLCFKRILPNHVCAALNVREIDREGYVPVPEPVLVSTVEEDEATMRECVSELLSDRQTSVLITGKAGSGKSYSINRIKEQLSGLVLTATTAKAALGGAGVTLHSFLGMLPGRSVAECIRILSAKKKNKIRAMKYLSVEEVSMWSAADFEKAHEICKHVRGVESFFGGVRLLLSGDFAQLEPVKCEFFYTSPLFSDAQKYLRRFVLKTPHRFPNPTWAQRMDRLHEHVVTPDDEFFYLSRVRVDLETCLRDAPAHTTVAYGLNKSVDKLNESELSKLTTPSHSIAWSVQRKTGEVLSPSTFWVKDLINKEIGFMTQVVKVGAKVMMISNQSNYEKTEEDNFPKMAIVNGSIGHIVEVEEKAIHVLFGERRIPIELKRTTKTVDNLIVSYFPLRLAYALTIHSLQGMSLDSLIVCASKKELCFEASAYVALSRVREPEGLFLFDLDLEHLREVPSDVTNQRFLRWCAQPESGSFFHDERGEIVERRMIHANMQHAVRFYRKEPGEHLLERNLCVFDLETATNENGEHVCYANNVIYVRNGVLREVNMRPVSEAVQHLCKMCDPSYDPRQAMGEYVKKLILDLRKERGELMSKCARAKRKQDKYSYSEEECAEHGGKDPHTLTVCAFNGGAFDFHFLMQFIKKDEELLKKYKLRIVNKTACASRICCMVLTDLKDDKLVVMQTMDPAQILQMSLKSALASYLPNTPYSKGCFPHNFMSGFDFSAPVPLLKEFMLTAADFPEKVDASVTGGLSVFPYRLHEESHRYAMSDVLNLWKLVKKLDETVIAKVGTSVMYFQTAAKLAWSALLSKLHTDFLQKRKVFETRQKYGLVITQLYNTTREDDLTLSRSCVGGRVAPRTQLWESMDMGKPYAEIEQYFIDADINGMYAHLMMQYEYPFGLMKKLEQGEEYDRVVLPLLNGRTDTCCLGTPLFILKGVVSLNPHDLEPCIGFKQGPKGKLMWENFQRQEVVLTSVDVYLVLKNEGVIHSVECIYLWEKHGRVFNSWIDEVDKDKQKATVDGNIPMRSLCKLLCNTTYGSTLQRDHDEQFVFVGKDDQTRMQDFHDQFETMDMMNIASLINGEDSMVMMKGRQRKFLSFEYCDRPRYLGYFVLAYSRLLSDEIIDAVLPERREGTLASTTLQQLYGDTDSFLIRGDRAHRLAHMFHERTGGLSDDLNKKSQGRDFGKIVGFASCGPKSYALRYVTPDNVVSEKVVFKGVPQKQGVVFHPVEGAAVDKLSYAFFREQFALSQQNRLEKHGVEVHFKSPVRAKGMHITPSDASRGLSHFSISSEQSVRTLFKEEWKGRSMSSTGWYVPNGWKLK